jgi:pimeloyl-ACP methyl ester carboxylesterase
MPTAHTIPVDGTDLAAVHHAAGGDRWLVCCHGFLSDKSGSYEGRCERAVAEGYDAVRFDFRGCGESGGDFVDQTLSAKLADLRAVLDHFEPASCALFGSSFGGKVALHAAPDDGRVEVVATRAPVTYNRAFDEAREAVDREGRHEFETGQAVDGRFFEDFERYPFADAAADLDVPVAILHGGADESVPIADSLDAAAALETDVLFERFAGEGHRFSRAAEARLRDRLFDWLGHPS